MKTPLVLLALALCALPLLAEKADRRVVAPCELTTASVIASGVESQIQGREFSVRVFNNSGHAIALPRSPVFGWRVDALDKKKVWRFKAEGGPVLRVSKRANGNDPHIVVVGHPAIAPLVEILPAHSQDFHTFLPEAEKALRPEGEGQLYAFKLTLFWAAPLESAQTSQGVPLCGLAPEWVVTAQRPTLPK